MSNNNDTMADNAKDLEEQLTNQKLIELQRTFEEADEDGGGGLDMDEFRLAMRKAMGQDLSDEELDLIFMKVDTNCDGTVDWDEYLSYMLLEYTEKDIMNFMVKEKPLPQNCKMVPNMHEYQRRHDSIVKVQCMPAVTKLKGATYEASDAFSGRYLSVTKEGMLNSWSMDLAHLATHRITAQMEQVPFKEHRSSMWVTDMVVLPNFNMIAVATSASSLLFYEMRVGGGIQQTVQIVDMEIFVTTMDYWYDTADKRNAILIWGDGRGNICALRFFSCYQVCVLHQSVHKKPNYKLKFTDLLSNKRCGVEAYRLPNIHKDFVLQVKYCPTLGLFISCSGDPGSSLYMGDLDHKRRAYFQANSGTTAFDYCKINNVIVSGGKDAIVRIWNPYLTHKPVTLLHGHKAAVTNIIINETKEHIISISENKDILIFDMDTQTVIQHVRKKYLRPLGQRSISAAMFNQNRQALVLATNQLAIWEHREEELRTQALTTHSSPIHCVLYNKLFKQLVTGSSDSLVCVWDIETGKRIIQFFAYKSVVHGREEYGAISVMTFDTTLRRLITGSRNGSVKIWNFNNGACLNELEVFERMEVTGIVCFRQRIITAGWNQRLTVYMDAKDEEDEGVTRWPVRHNDEIRTLAHNPPSTVASGSYDGDIFIWSLETGYITMHFNAEKSVISLSGLESRSFDCTGSPFESLHEGHLDDVFGHMSVRGPVYEEDIASRRRGLILNSNMMRFQTQARNSILPDIEGKAPLRGKRRTSLLPPPPMTMEPPSIDMHKGAVFTHAGKAVEKLLFLETRKNARSTATLVSCGSAGWVRMWSVHHEGGLIGQFCAAHKKDESVTTMATDLENNYLITADSAGYVKVWDIADFCTAKHGRGHTKADIARRTERIKKFRLPGLDPILRRQAADQSKHNPPPDCTRPSRTWRVPPILTSFRGHLKGIFDLCYINEQELIVTSSADRSVRMWTITGLFIGIFGQGRPWSLSPSVQDGPPAKTRQSVVISKLRALLGQGRKLPPDVRRVASATTLKMFYGGPGPLKHLAKSVILIWITMALKSKAKTHHPRRATVGATEPIVEATPVKAQEEETGTSSILGVSYQPTRKHQKLPDIRRPRIFKNQCAVYSSLPYYPLEEVDNNLRPPKHVAEILERQQAFSKRWMTEKGRSRSRQKVLPVRSVSDDAVVVKTGGGDPMDRGQQNRKHRP